MADKRSLREVWFHDWSPEREENPNGIRDLLGTSTPPLMRDPAEAWVEMRASLPGDEGYENPLWDGENPYSTMNPRQLRALLEDRTLSSVERKRVTEAWYRLAEFEGGKMPEAPESASAKPPTRKY
jgi:hypothetical protein